MQDSDAIDALKKITGGLPRDEVWRLFREATGHANFVEARQNGMMPEEIVQAVEQTLLRFQQPGDALLNGGAAKEYLEMPAPRVQETPSFVEPRLTILPSTQDIKAMDELAGVYSGLLQKSHSEVLILMHYCYAKGLPLDLILTNDVYLMRQKNTSVIHMGITAMRIEAYQIKGIRLVSSTPVKRDNHIYGFEVVVENRLGVRYKGYYDLNMAHKKELLSRPAWANHPDKMLQVRAEHNALAAALGYTAGAVDVD